MPGGKYKVPFVGVAAIAAAIATVSFVVPFPNAPKSLTLTKSRILSCAERGTLPVPEAEYPIQSEPVSLAKLSTVPVCPLNPLKEICPAVPKYDVLLCAVVNLTEAPT